MHLLKSDYKTCTISHKIAKAFISKYHYSKSCSNTSKLCIGLFNKKNCKLMGAAIWMLPPAGVVKKYNTGPRGMLSLSRLAIHPDVPTNGASYLIGQSIKRIYRFMPEIQCLITFADGMQGHEGAIYKATNWRYDGLTPATYRWVDDTGKLISSYSTRRISTSILDEKYKRIGPFKKHRFVLFRGKKTFN